MAGTGELGSPVALERKGGCARTDGADVVPAATVGGAAATGTAGRTAGTGELGSPVALERKRGCARIDGADVVPAATVGGAAVTGTAGRTAGTGELSAPVAEEGKGEGEETGLVAAVGVAVAALALEENDGMPFLPPLTPNVLELLLGTVVFEMKDVRGDCGRGTGSCTWARRRGGRRARRLGCTQAAVVDRDHL